jgi:hypothetical protein
MTGMVFEIIQASGVVATAIGVSLAYWELRRSEKQRRTDFEDGFPREYRQLTQDLPVKALLGEPLDSDESAAARSAFFRYVDLCNEQVFLRQNNRISETTWRSWCGGIASNLRLPAFKSAWEEFKVKTDSFAELRRLEEAGFNEDPIQWGRRECELTQQRWHELDLALKKAA